MSFDANVSIRNTARDTYDISLPCASVYCQTAPKDRYNHTKALYISIGASFLSCHIFLSLYSQSFTSNRIVLFIPRSTPAIISLEDLYILISGLKSQFSSQSLENELFGNGLPTLSKFFGAVFD